MSQIEITMVTFESKIKRAKLCYGLAENKPSEKLWSAQRILQLLCSSTQRYTC